MSNSPVYRISSDSGRPPGLRHQVWANWVVRTDDGTLYPYSSRSRMIAVTDDRDHAERITDALNHPAPSSNFPAVLAAVRARGPRCRHCGNWTFRPELSGSPVKDHFCGYQCIYASLRKKIGK
jgi:hypothetical protein